MIMFCSSASYHHDILMISLFDRSVKQMESAERQKIEEVKTTERRIMSEQIEKLKDAEPTASDPKPKHLPPTSSSLSAATPSLKQVQCASIESVYDSLRMDLPINMLMIKSQYGVRCAMCDV